MLFEFKPLAIPFDTTAVGQKGGQEQAKRHTLAGD